MTEKGSAPHTRHHFIGSAAANLTAPTNPSTGNVTSSQFEGESGCPACVPSRLHLIASTTQYTRLEMLVHKKPDHCIAQVWTAFSSLPVRTQLLSETRAGQEHLVLGGKLAERVQSIRDANEKHSDGLRSTRGYFRLPVRDIMSRVQEKT